MHNQGINSLALLSARRTMEAADLVAHMCACHIYVSCQAVELRATHRLFLETLHDKIKAKDGPFHVFHLNKSAIKDLGEKVFTVVEKAWYDHNAGCWKDRIVPTVDAAMAPVTQYLTSEEVDCPISSLAVFREKLHKSVVEVSSSIFYPNMAIRPVDVATKLGDGTAPLYAWVRSKLGVPTQCGIDDDSLYNAQKGLPTEGKKTIGSWVSIVYESLKDDMMDVVMEFVDACDRPGPKTEEQYESLCQGLASRN
ncbi:hypothetical protein ACHAPM_007172 [Fusarium culmorum]